MLPLHHEPIGVLLYSTSTELLDTRGMLPFGQHETPHAAVVSDR